MKLLIPALVAAFVIAGCDRPGTKDSSSRSEESTVTPAEEIDGMSIYQLTSRWKTQDGDEIAFQDLSGDVLVVVMIYTSCQSACPRLVEDMKAIESKVSASISSGVRYVLVSIDPTYDTPERLKAFSIENDMEDPCWLFLQGTEESVREFANVVAVRYDRISPMDFSHSNIISVFDQRGVMLHQQEGLATEYKETVETVLSAFPAARAR